MKIRRTINPNYLTYESWYSFIMWPYVVLRVKTKDKYNHNSYLFSLSPFYVYNSIVSVFSSYMRFQEIQ